MSASILEIEDLTVDYQLDNGALRAVDAVSLSISKGEILGVVGESGSGKSTLAAAILDLLDPPARIVSGAIRYFGDFLPRGEEKDWESIRGRQIGMVFQSPQNSFNPCMTIGLQIEQALRTHYPMTRGEAREKLLKAMGRVKLPRPEEVLDSYAFELSGGMCQRAALASALVLEPQLLIADEPTSSLDLMTQVEITALLEEIHRDAGLSMIIISHDIGFVSRLASHLAVMHRGKVVEDGRINSVLGAPRSEYTKTLLNSIPRLDMER